MSFWPRRLARDVGIKRFKRSYLTATIICFAVALWVLSGEFADGDGEARLPGPTDGAIPPSQQQMTVRVAGSVSREFTREIVVRGRTEAFRKVDLKAETAGKVVALPVEKGKLVKEGDTVCRLAMEDRQARLAEASALARQRQLEYDAATKLAEKGYRSENQAAAAAAALDAAKAQVKRMEVELDNVIIRAPFTGIVEARPVEIGDYLTTGGTCATLVDEDPYLVVGEVSERDVDVLKVGGNGRVELADGRTLVGTIRFIAQTASPVTRTFRVELVVPNPEGTLRDGLTSEIHVPVKSTAAHFVSPGQLVLNDSGKTGLRVVDANNRVHFQPVTILGEGEGGIWVSGLPERADIIVVGQDFVREGESVIVTRQNGGAQS